SRVFLTSINPATSLLDPGSLHGSIVSYEHIPRYTNRSSRFARIRGRWEPMSSTQAESDDGSVSKSEAKAYMQDLVSYGSRPKNQALFAKRRALWRKLHGLLKDPSQGAQNTRRTLKKILTEGKGDPYVEAAVRDFLEFRSIRMADSPVLKPEDLGLAQAAANITSGKFQLIQQFPQWQDVLEDPEKGIAKLIKKGEFGTLGAILDSIDDTEIRMLAARELGRRQTTPALKNFVSMLIEKGDPKMIETLAREIFTQPNAAQMPEQFVQIANWGLEHDP